MPLKQRHPILYLITDGRTTHATNSESPEFSRLLALVRAAAISGIHLIQLREKNLTARTLFELARRAAEITRDTGTRIIVNDRADIARAARCCGVHLTARSLSASVVRKTFGADFLIGVSTHSLEEAREAESGGADFAVFGPIFDTPSKREYGPPLGLDNLRAAAQSLPTFPLIAIGGITLANAHDALRAGASGIAAIRLFSDPQKLEAIAKALL